MKTKEQILETALDSHHVSGLVEEGGRIWRAILEAMEDYRNQPSSEGVKRHVEIGIANEAYRVWCETEGKNPHTPADFNLFCSGFRKGYLNQYQPGEREGVKSAHDYLKAAYDNITGHGGEYDAGIEALTAQAWDHEHEMEEFVRFIFPHTGVIPQIAITQFRNDRSKPKESPICCCDTDVICNLHWRGE